MIKFYVHQVLGRGGGGDSSPNTPPSKSQKFSKVAKF